MVRALKFRIYEVEGLYYICSESIGADQLRGRRAADLCLCFRICNIRFSHGAAQSIPDGAGASGGKIGYKTGAPAMMWHTTFSERPKSNDVSLTFTCL